MICRSIFFFLFTVVLSSTGFSQGQAQPKLIDEFGAALCSDDLRARIDLFLSTVHGEPGTIGSVNIVPDEKIPGRAKKYRRIIENHLRFRGFGLNRITFSERTSASQSNISLWLVPPGVKLGDPVEAPKRITETTLFDATGIWLDRKNGVSIGGAWADEPCDFGLLFDQIADELKKQADLSAHILYTSGNRVGTRKAKEALNTVVSQLKKNGVLSARIRPVYVGRRQEAEIQVWLVPENGTQPKLRSDVVPF